MNRLAQLKFLAVSIGLIFCIVSFAQEDVEISPMEKFFKVEIGGVAAMVLNSSSPYNFGGGFYFAYHESLKSNDKIELGGHFEFTFMKTSSVYFDDNPDFFNNNGSISRLSFVTSYHPLRMRTGDLFAEIHAGFLFSSATSTYYSDSYDEDGSVEKFFFYPALDAGVSLGVVFADFLTVKLLYHQSTSVKQAQIDDVAYQNGLIFPFKKTPFSGLNIYIGLAIGNH